MRIRTLGAIALSVLLPILGGSARASTEYDFNDYTLDAPPAKGGKFTARQAFALTGDASATDPTCSLAPEHGLVLAARSTAVERPPRRYLSRSPRSSLRDASPTKFSLS